MPTRSTAGCVRRWPTKIGLAIPEPSGGGATSATCAPPHVTLTATVRVVNGSKTFITSGVRADFVVTAVRTGGASAGKVRCSSSKRARPGSPLPASSTRWLAGPDTAELSYQDVRVPTANLVGAEKPGFAQIANAFVTERVALAVQAYAHAHSAALTSHWPGSATARPSAVRSSPRQSVQNTVTEMARRIDVARTCTRAVVEKPGEWVTGGLDRRSLLREEHRR